MFDSIAATRGDAFDGTLLKAPARRSWPRLARHNKQPAGLCGARPALRVPALRSSPLLSSPLLSHVLRRLRLCYPSSLVTRSRCPNSHSLPTLLSLDRSLVSSLLSTFPSTPRRHAFVQDHPRVHRPRGPLLHVGLGHRCPSWCVRLSSPIPTYPRRRARAAKPLPTTRQAVETVTRPARRQRAPSVCHASQESISCASLEQPS